MKESVRSAEINECAEISNVLDNAFNNIAVELLRALNFYRFSNPESELADIWLCGGGAAIGALTEAIAAGLDNMTFHSADELMPGGRALEESYSLAQAIGITQE